MHSLSNSIRDSVTFNTLMLHMHTHCSSHGWGTRLLSSGMLYSLHMQSLQLTRVGYPGHSRLVLSPLHCGPWGTHPLGPARLNAREEERQQSKRQTASGKRHA
jgi:hypothetical protein